MLVFLVNDLERAERNCRDSKHNAKLAAERMETDIELLKKKLAHEKELSMRELRSFRTPYNIVGDSGLHSPERRGEYSISKIKTNFLKIANPGSMEEY